MSIADGSPRPRFPGDESPQRTPNTVREQFRRHRKRRSAAGLFAGQETPSRSPLSVGVYTPDLANISKYPSPPSGETVRQQRREPRRRTKKLEESLLEDVWKLLLAGRLDEAQDLCRSAGQAWRAASLGGCGELGPSPSVEAWQTKGRDWSLQAVELESGAGHQRRLWKWACYFASEKIGGSTDESKYEAAIFATQCGNVKRMLPVCYIGRRTEMDVKKQSVAETWQALKTTDAYCDRRRKDKRLQTNWNSFATLSKTTTESDDVENSPFILGSSKYQTLSKAAIEASFNKHKVEDAPFILGTPIHQFEPEELQRTLSCAAKAVLQSQEAERKGSQSNYDCNPDNRRKASDDMQTQTTSSYQLERKDAERHGYSVPNSIPATKQVTFQKGKQKIVPLHDKDLTMRINMDVNCLLDPLADVRYDALLSIHCALLGDFPGEVCIEQSQLQQNEEAVGAISKVACTGLFECPEKFMECAKEVVTKSLLRRFEDPSEKCRLLAISIIKALLQTSPPTMVSLMSYILPVMIERLPIKSLPTEEDSSSQVEIEIVEKSEEVRLMLIQLLHNLIMFAKKKTKYFASELASILTAAAMDNYHEVLLETFASMTLFGEICKQKLKPVAKQLISVVLCSLSHNRQRVRVAAVKAIHRLVLCGSHESIYDLTAYRDPNLVPIKAFYQPCPKTQYLALLVSDKSIKVREQLLLTVASWLCELDERKEHECRLVPYIMTGFTDENPTIQDLAFDLMEQVGHKYEEENENEVADLQVYLPEDIDELNFTSSKERFLPRAFKSRPCLGARIMVRSCLAVCLHALGGDLDAWTSGTKGMAAEFLYTLIMFCEENITMHLQALIVIMSKAFKDPLIEKKIAKCAKVLGFFPEPEIYLKVVVPMINGELNVDLSNRQLAANLKMLASIMQGSPRSRLTKHIPEICSLLTAPDLLTSIQIEVNEGIVAIAQEMMGAWSREESKDEIVPILWLLLNCAASSDFCGRSAQKAESVLKDLALINGVASGQALMAAHGEKILDLLPHPIFWALRSLDVLVFCRVFHVVALVELLETLPRVFRLLVFFGKGSLDLEIKQRLLHATQNMATFTSSLDLQQDRLLALQEQIGIAFHCFFVPCLEYPSLYTLVLETLSKILSIEMFSNIAIPKSLTSALEELIPPASDSEPLSNMKDSSSLQMVNERTTESSTESVKDVKYGDKTHIAADGESLKVEKSNFNENWKPIGENVYCTS